jgi:hypothetical protein
MPRHFPGLHIFACTKHAGDMEEETIPTATFILSSPVEGTLYQRGDSILIQGLAISTDEIHGYDISIKDAADTSVTYFANHIHDHNDTISINQKWKNTLAASANLQVEVTLTLDHHGHTSSKKVGVKTQN